MRTNLFPYDTHKLGLDLESCKYPKAFRCMHMHMLYIEEAEITHSFVLDGSQTKDLMYNWTSEAITISGFNPPGFLITEFNGTTNLKVTSTGKIQLIP